MTAKCYHISCWPNVNRSEVYKVGVATEKALVSIFVLTCTVNDLAHLLVDEYVKYTYKKDDIFQT